MADKILADVDAADTAAAGLQDVAARELRSTITDLTILAHLARYHAARMKAAVWYNVYLQTKDSFALKHCVDEESRAVGHWKQIIASAGDVYPETLKFGVRRVGFSWHWKEELVHLEEGLKQLRKLRGENTLSADARRRLVRRAAQLAAEPSLVVHVDRAASAIPGRDLKITAAVQTDSPLEAVRLRYRHLTQFEDYETVAMTVDSATGKYVGTIPGSFIVPEWDVMYFVEAITRDGIGRSAPDLEQQMPYVIVPVKR